MASNFTFLDRTAARIFRAITTTPDGNLIRGARTIDNAAGAFMAVHVEQIGLSAIGPVFSVAHYYEQNGDLVCDPDMTFAVDVTTAGAAESPTLIVMPLTFEQGGVVYQVACELDGDERIMVNSPLQAQLAAFANRWLRNIADQQGIDYRAAATTAGSAATTTDARQGRSVSMEIV